MNHSKEEIKYSVISENTKKIVETPVSKTSIIKSNVQSGMEKAGYYLGKGWNSIKDGVSSVGSTIKQSSIGKKTSKGVKKVKESQFSQKVKEGIVITGEFMKESARKTGRVIQKTAKVTKNKWNNLTKERKQKSNETTLVEVSNVSQVSDV